MKNRRSAALIAITALGLALLTGCASDVDKARSSVADARDVLVSSQQANDDVIAKTEPLMAPAIAKYDDAMSTATRARDDALKASKGVHAQADTASAQALEVTTTAAEELRAQENVALSEQWEAWKVNYHAEVKAGTMKDTDIEAGRTESEQRQADSITRAADALTSARETSTTAIADALAAQTAADAQTQSAYDQDETDAAQIRDIANAEYVKTLKAADDKYRAAQGTYDSAVEYLRNLDPSA